MSRRRVVVTGMGTSSPLGGDVASTWEAMLAGKSGVRRLTEDWVEDMPVKIAAPAAVDPTEVLERVKARRLDRTSQLAMVAAREAWADAGLDGADLDKERLGVAVASGIGGVTTLLSNYDALRDKGPRRVSPLAVPMLMPNAPAANVSLMFGARAAANTPVSACASGNEGISLALDQIRLDRADMVLAGGTEAAIHPLPMAAFANMMALSKNEGDPATVSRPWDTARDGFVMGEGAGILVLEELEHAKARGAKIYAEVLGYGMSGDAFHLTAPAEDGNGAFRSMRNALRSARLSPDKIDYINAHGTSTPLGDEIELGAVKRLFGDHAYELSMSSTKSAIGHLLGAAGSVEAIFAILALRDGVVPPTLNLDNPSPSCDIDLVPKRAKERRVRYALSNSFGFGGTNASLIFAGPTSAA